MKRNNWIALIVLIVLMVILVAAAIYCGIKVYHGETLSSWVQILLRQ